MKQTVNLEMSLPNVVEIEEAKGAKTGILVLHGFSDRGSAAKRRLLGLEPLPGVTVIAPNGMFPAPKREVRSFKEAFAWYFRDPYTGKVTIPAHVAVSGLKQLIQKLGMSELDWILLGFSQGGFLAPMLAHGALRTCGIISVGALGRTEDYKGLAGIPLFALHGADDDVISCKEAESSYAALKKVGVHCEFHALAGVDHTLNDEGRALVRKFIAQLLKSSPVKASPKKKRRSR